MVVVPFLPHLTILLSASSRRVFVDDHQKWATMQFAAALFLLLWAFRLVVRKRDISLPSAGSSIVLIAYAVAHLALAGTTSVAPQTSLDRAAQVMSVAILCLAVASQCAGNPRRVERLLLAFVLSTGTVALYGLAQSQGYDFPGFPGGAFGKAVATIGNTNTAGALLAPAAGVALAGFLAHTGRVSWVFGVSLALITGHLVATSSRGAWIAAATGAAGVVAALIANRHRPGPGIEGQVLKRRGLILGIGALVGIGLLGLGGGLGELGRRIGSIPSSTHNTNRVRYHVARSTLTMIADRPLLGHGPGTFPIAYPPFRAPEEVRVSGYDRAVLSAHNEGLETLVEGGAFLAIPLAILVFLIAVQCVRGTLREKRSWTHAAITGALLAIVTLTPFRSILRNPSVTLTCGLITGILISQGRRSSFGVGGRASKSLAIATMIGLSIWIGTSGTKLLLGDLAAQEAQGKLFQMLETRGGDPQEQLRRLDETKLALSHARNLLPNNLDVGRKYARHLQDLRRITGDATLLSQTVTECRRLLAVAPNDRATRITLSLSLNELGRVNEATEVLEELERRMPWDPRAPDNLALYSLNGGNDKKAREHFSRMAEIDPDYAIRRHQELLDTPGRERASILLFQVLIEKRILAPSRPQGELADKVPGTES